MSRKIFKPVKGKNELLGYKTPSILPKGLGYHYVYKLPNGTLVID